MSGELLQYTNLDVRLMGVATDGMSSNLLRHTRRLPPHFAAIEVAARSLEAN
jgi:hypothetical protein